MQLFQEYIVGAVNRRPFMFTVTSGDITFLEQFPPEYWVDALWIRYNTVLYQALKNREKAREEAGYNEFVKAKYHEILDNLSSVDLDIQIKKKRALMQALNLAEERYYHINVKNKVRSFRVRALNYEASSRNRIEKTIYVKANDYIEELVRSLEKTPMSKEGYDLTGVRSHEVENENTKSRYSSRGFQFPSRDTIRKSLRRWIEFVGADLHNLTTSRIPDSEKEEFTHFRGSEINELYEKHWIKEYFNFFRNLSKATNLITWYSANSSMFNRISGLLRNNSIDELARSVKGSIGTIQFIKERFLEITQPKTRIKGLQETQTYLRDRSRVKYLSLVLGKTELRVARITGTYTDPHGRFPRYDADTNTDERLNPRIKMKEVKVNVKNSAGEDFGELTVKVPDMKRGRMLYPIHDRPDLQSDERAVGHIDRFEDLHLPPTQKSRTSPFMIITPEDFESDRSLKKNLRIISGGLIPNQDSPQRSGVISNEEGFVNKMQDIRSIFNYLHYEFARDSEGLIKPFLKPIKGKVSLSRIVVDYLESKLKTIKKEQAHGHEIIFEWKEWHRCMDETDYKRLHDHCVEIMSDNYTRISSGELSKEIKDLLDDLFTRMMHLDFGSGTFKQRRIPVYYDCKKIKHIINRFYSGVMYITSASTSDEDREEGRKHDLANRAEYREKVRESDDEPHNRLQLHRALTNAYLPKFSGPDARSSAELCASSFMRTTLSSGQDVEAAIRAEITRLSDASAEANCAIASIRADFKRAYEIINSIRSNMKKHVTQDEMNVLGKFTSEESTHFNRNISNLVEYLKRRTNTFIGLLNAIKSYTIKTSVGLTEVQNHFLALENMPYSAIILSDSVRDQINKTLGMKAKMSRLPEIRVYLQSIIA